MSDEQRLREAGEWVMLGFVDALRRYQRQRRVEAVFDEFVRTVGTRVQPLLDELALIFGVGGSHG